MASRAFSVLLCLCALLHFTLANSPTNEYQVVNCSVPNDCAYVPSQPYCISGTCRQCDPTRTGSQCDCMPGSYCIQYEDDPEYGFCREFEAEIIGSNCDRALNGKGMQTRQGINDTVFCGKVVYADTYEAIVVEWEGSCQMGRCMQCTVAPIPCLPISLCNDGRACNAGYYEYADVGIFSWNYAKYNTLLTAFYFSSLEMFLAGPLIGTFFAITCYYVWRIYFQD